MHNDVPQTPQYSPAPAVFDCYISIIYTKVLSVRTLQEEKEEIWLGPMIKAVTPTENSKKQCVSKRHKQRLRTDLER